VSESHSSHGDIEQVEKDTRVGTLSGFECQRCGLIAPDGDADETFRNNDCEQYRSVGEGILSN